MQRIGMRWPRTGWPTRIGSLLAILLSLACAACSKPEAASRGPASSGPVVVVTAAARVEPLGVDIEAVGTTLANESVQLTSKASNTITAIRFAEGSEVARGAVLVEMQDAEEQAALAEAQAALVDSQNQYNRSRDLLARQALSVAELDQLEATLKANQARVAAAQARLDDTVIRAPFSGRTGFRQVSVGSYVGAGTLITTLDDTSVIKLDFTVPETFLFMIRRGLPVTALSDGLPNRTFNGVVTNMDARVDPVTRTIAVRAELANKDDALRQGMFMTVLLKGEESAALLVPEEAIVPEQGRTYVFVVHDKSVERREVHIGKRRPGDVEIVSGLAKDERVVIEGTQHVRDGTAVEESQGEVS
jgi:membrane fusion protein (multidrug efflux system)